MSIGGAEHIKKIAFNTDQINVWRTYLKERLTNNTNTSTDLSWAIIGANMFKPSNIRIKVIEEILKNGYISIDHHLYLSLLVYHIHTTCALKHGHYYKYILSLI